MYKGKRISIIIPARNEEDSISRVIGDLPEGLADEVIVVDNGSVDGTKDAAAGCGARVVPESERGYGASCLKGISSVKDPDIIVILDGDYSDYPEQITRILDPIIMGGIDLCLGSRVLGKREDGAMAPLAYWGNKLSVFLIDRFFGYHYTDMGPFRAIRFDKLKTLCMQDRDYGWNAEMQIKAIKRGLNIKEVAVDYRKRIGSSKISGTVKGTIKAGSKILYTIFKYRFNNK